VTIASRFFVLIAGLAAGFVALAQPAAAMERDAQQARIIAASRYGQINARLPKITVVSRGGYTPAKDMIRPRFAGGMIDIYPATHNGFRVSVGNRYFSQTNFWRDSEQATNGLLFDPHMVRGGISLQQRVYRKWTPAALVGYDTQIAPGLVAGVEGGTLFGAGINRGPRRFSQSRNEDPQMNGRGLNPVATVSMRYAF
jgi:hypothetical protein